MKITSFVAVCLLVLTVVVPPAWSSQRAAPTNLQVLPEDADIRMIMQGIGMALGVQCSYCHVQGDMASDEIDKKNIARGMMRMVRAINGDFLSNVNADARTNCMMCHRGAAIPTTD